jgi:AcrR family transcriptional regulator
MTLIIYTDSIKKSTNISFFYTHSSIMGESILNERKKQVMKAAHDLFVEKGFVKTSVQDILDKSGISKGTFYNYFPSKKELLISIFEKINMETEQRRMEVLAGRPVDDQKAFIEQIKVKMEISKENKLFALFHGVLVSEDEDLKKIVQQHHFDELRWIQKRIVEVFGEQVRPYSVDLAILLYGMVQNTIHFAVHTEAEVEISHIISYAMRRLKTIASDVVRTNDQLFQLDLLKRLEPESSLKRKEKKAALIKKISLLEQTANEEQKELLSFLKDELQSSVPRRSLVQAVLSHLDKKKELEELVNDVLEE